MVIKFDSKFRVVIPEEIRRKLGIEKGDKLALVLNKDRVEIRKASKEEDKLALTISKNIKEIR